jgi:hypothetical protein
MHVTYKHGLWRPSAENDISEVHRQNVDKSETVCDTQTHLKNIERKSWRAIKGRRHFRPVRLLAPEMVLQPFLANINGEQSANNKTWAKTIDRTQKVKYMTGYRMVTPSPVCGNGTTSRLQWS